MQKILFSILCLSLVTACEKEPGSPAVSDGNPALEFHNSTDKIEVCHYSKGNGINWGGSGIDINELENKTTQEAALADFDGPANTRMIVENIDAANFAAKVCANLEYNGCDDWYLPALGELQAMYDQLGGTGNNNFNGNAYWSSTEADGLNAWRHIFADGRRGSALKTIGTTSCRCVRR